jgi:hypothetical protein
MKLFVSNVRNRFELVTYTSPFRGECVYVTNPNGEINRNR